MKIKFLHSLGSLLGIVLFTIALWVLHHELKAYHYHDIILQLREFPFFRLLLALLLTVQSYLIMTGYDALALRYINHPLAYGKIALASFVAYAFSNNMGFFMVAGGSIRYRLYSAWEFSALEITKVVAFCSLSLWLGFVTLGGLVFIIEPLAIPHALHLPFVSVRPIGVIFFLLVAVYFFTIHLRKKSFTIHGWEFTFPSTGLSLAQIAVATLDWALAGSVLYVLLPGSLQLSYLGFLSIFLLAQIAGLVSQVPGGLGVFETMVILMLSPTLPAAELVGSLLAYRGIYYILPLLVATIMFGAQEVCQRGKGLKRIASLFIQRSSVVAPHVLAWSTFFAGVVLLFSGSTPAIHWRMIWLKNFLPLPAVEISHFLGSVVGMGLLLLAKSLQRRIDAAYFFSVALLGAGIVLSLLKGLDYEEAIILSIMLGAILPCRRYFYRKASLISHSFEPEWIAAIILALLCTAWLGLFSYKHVEYSDDLWWHFTISGDAPRSIRAFVGSIGLILAFTMSRLLRPAVARPAPDEPKDLARVETIVRQSRKTHANLALLGDKEFLFSKRGNAFIMYAIEGRSWVSMGDPIGPAEEWPEMLWRFCEMCDRYDGWKVFYEIAPENLPLYLDLGLTLLKLGEEARIPLEGFSLEGHARKGLRHGCRRLEKEGCAFEVIPLEGVPPLMTELKQISDAWLKEKHTREKGFSLGFFNEEYLKRFPAGLVRKEGKVLAFVNILPGTEKEELSLDLMRYIPEAPQGIMDYLFVRLMLWGKREGYRWFNLGMAPLSGLADHSLAPLWNRVGAYIFRHGEHFYNFQGLRDYKEKFDPQWEPRYLACPGGLAIPRILANIASLIAGGMKGVIAK